MQSSRPRKPLMLPTYSNGADRGFRRPTRGQAQAYHYPTSTVVDPHHVEGGCWSMGFICLIFFFFILLLALGPRYYYKQPYPPHGGYPPPVVLVRDPNDCATGERLDRDLNLCMPIVNAPLAMERSILDDGVRACDGFFEHACGVWIQEHMNEDRAFSSIYKENEAQVRDIITNPGPGSDDGIYDFFQSCKSTLVEKNRYGSNRRRKIVMKQIEAGARETELERSYMIGKVLRRLVHLDNLPETLAQMTMQGFTIPFMVDIENHPSQPRLIPMLKWDGFVLPSGGEEEEAAVSQLMEPRKVPRLLEILRIMNLHKPSSSGGGGGTDGDDFIGYLKSGTLENRDTVSFGELDEMLPQSWWKRYFKHLGKAANVNFEFDDEQPIWVVSGKEYFGAPFFTQLSVEDWRLYIEFSINIHTRNFFPDLPSDVYYRQHDRLHPMERHSYWKLNPTTTAIPVDGNGGGASSHRTIDDCVRATKFLLPGLVAKRYLAEDFPHGEETRTRVQTMTERIRDHYAQLIRETQWMDEETRQKAVEKIESIIVRVLHPNQWEAEPFGEQMDKDRYLRNLNIIRAFRVRKNFQLWNIWMEDQTQDMKKRNNNNFDRDRISLFSAPLSTVNGKFHLFFYFLFFI